MLAAVQAQAVSNTAWALATLAYLPEGDLLQELALRATAIITTFRPQATSNTLCVLRPHPRSLQCLSAAAACSKQHGRATGFRQTWEEELVLLSGW